MTALACDWIVKNQQRIDGVNPLLSDHINHLPVLLKFSKAWLA